MSASVANGPLQCFTAASSPVQLLGAEPWRLCRWWR